MNSKTRSRALIGVAVAVGAYVILTPPESPTIDSAHAERTPTIRREAHTSLTPARNATSALSSLAHRVTDAAASGALFSVQSWYVPPPPSAPSVSTTSVKSLTPPPPTAPALPFAYMGTFTPDGANPVFFLTQGDRVFDVRVGETVDDIYTVDGISNGQLQLTYKPLNIKQQLTVGSSP